MRRSGVERLAAVPAGDAAPEIVMQALMDLHAPPDLDALSDLHAPEVAARAGY